MKVFLAATSLRLAYGGPAYSVSRLAVALTEAGVRVGLWAADDSVANTPYLSIDSPVRRLFGSADEALSSFGRFDVIHDNGIWLLHNHRLARLAAERRVARVVSTRGMLEPWAMNDKRVKKCVAWALYQRADLMGARCHHATSEAEASNLHKLKLGVRVCVIPNGVDLPDISVARANPKIGKESSRQKAMLFLGRVHPVKGLPMLIEAWARVRPNGWILQIAGPDEAGHRSQMEKAVLAAGLSGVISFIGPLDGDAKRSAFLGADLFILPTRSESFGMVIAEALGHGLPVLTTTRAPWPLRQRGCGWSMDPTVDGIAEGLRQATSLDPLTLYSMGEKGREFAAAEFGWEHVAERFAAMYEKIAVCKQSCDHGKSE